VPARSSLPHPFLVPPRATPYTPLQLLFLARLAHLVTLCYHGRHMSGGESQQALVRHVLRSTIDDCFAVGLEPELLALLADGVVEEA